MEIPVMRRFVFPRFKLTFVLTVAGCLVAQSVHSASFVISETDVITVRQTLR